MSTDDPNVQHLLHDLPQDGQVYPTLCGGQVAAQPSANSARPVCFDCTRVMHAEHALLQDEVTKAFHFAAVAGTTVARLLALIADEGTFELKEQASVISQEGIAEADAGPLGDGKALSVHTVDDFDKAPDEVKDALMRFVTGYDKDAQ